MSKSVLVIDTPTNCGKCRFVNEFWCRAMNGMTLPIYDVIPDWCPLKELPKEDNDVSGDEFEDGFTSGWNACIREITGKNKENY